MTRRDKTEAPPLDLFSALEPPRAVPAPQDIQTNPGSADILVRERLAEVAVVGPMRDTFTYVGTAVWPQLIPGARVLVPFSRRTVHGFFIGERDPGDVRRSGIELAKLKPILKVLDVDYSRNDFGGMLLTPTLLALARWMARHYACALGSTLSSMLPAGVRKGSAGARIRVVDTVHPPERLCSEAAALLAKKPRQAALLLSLAAAQGALTAVELLQQADAPDSALKALEKAGLLQITEQKSGASAPDPADRQGRDDLVMNDEQQAAFDQIEAALRLGARKSESPDQAQDRRAFLLQGVTGSGKTEIYLRTLKTALAMGKQAIVLVPEIALTPQTASRFEQRLGRERVAVMHSHITDGERAEAWRAVRAGRIDVVVGARSALFAPLPRLGVIVIDEEQEHAFKQESTPRYHARDVAMELARLSGAVLILGSATPSFESYLAAKSGILKHLFLTKRVAGRPMPPVEIVDLTRENRETERYTYLSGRLLHAMSQTLSRGEQSILFMNRRGFATVITCLRCGYTEKCRNCDITLTSHRQAPAAPKLSPNGPNRLIVPEPPPRGTLVKNNSSTAGVLKDTGGLHCHYCGFNKPIPTECSVCGAPGVKHWGLGTERVENEVRKAFPSARVARMDSDTMTKRTAYLEPLTAFNAGTIDILIGTQMIAKGLDFPNVTLVGVVLADTSLHMPDFRGRERTFQLLAQVAGRSGRGEKGGRVIVQTHLPDDPAIRAAAQHDYETFSLNELRERRMFGYPPYTRLARILIRGKELDAVRAAAQTAAQALIKHAPPNVTLLGPSEASLAKLEGLHRQHILLKAPNSEVLSELLSGPAGGIIARLKGADAVVDVDPLAML